MGGPARVSFEIMAFFPVRLMLDCVFVIGSRYLRHVYDLRPT
jgi:hypothetical protein